MDDSNLNSIAKFQILESSYPGWNSRTELLLGKEKLNKLTNSKILIVGLGGVGAVAAEMICRSGIGNIGIVDSDVFQSSNLNRQVPSLTTNLGIHKADVLAEKLKAINPELKLSVHKKYLANQLIDELLDENYDYIIDAIDTLSPKLYLIYKSLKRRNKIVSSMGAGGKHDPSLVKISDISESYNCRLAFYIRKRLRRLGYGTGFKVVFSPEEVPEERTLATNEKNKKTILGTISYMPAIFGCYCASVVIRDITGLK